MQAQCALLTGSGQPLNKEEYLHTANQTLINSSIKQHISTICITINSTNSMTFNG